MRPTLPLFLSLLGCGAVSPGPRSADLSPYAPNDNGRQEVLCDAADRGYYNDIQVTGTGCTLTNILVDGNIFVRERASVTIDLAAVTGSLLTDGAAWLFVTGTEIDGFVQITGGGTVDVLGSEVIGSLRIEGSDGVVDLRENRIDGDLLALSNTGGVAVTNNTIGGDLECEDNTPSPTGEGNTVAGDNDGQCGGM